MSYRFVSDPAHGWLRVNINELVELGIHNKISEFSYIDKDNHVWLEEDCDMGTFLVAKVGDDMNAIHEWIGINTRVTSTNKMSRIRNLPSYPVPKS